MLRFLLGVMHRLSDYLEGSIDALEQPLGTSQIRYGTCQFSWEELSAMEDKAQAEYDAKKAADPLYPRKIEAEMMGGDPMSQFVSTK